MPCRMRVAGTMHQVCGDLPIIISITTYHPKIVIESTFDEIKRAGFKSVRIPVTWTDHFATQAPDCTSSPPYILPPTNTPQTRSMQPGSTASKPSLTGPSRKASG